MINQTKQRIWVLEDNNDDFDLLQLAFVRTALPVQLERFIRGEDLLMHLQNSDARLPRLLYVDLRMPGIGGMATLKALKNLRDFELIPRLVFSTSSNPPEIVEVYRNGGSAFHLKIVETPEMLSLLERTFLYWLRTTRLAPYWTGKVCIKGQKSAE